MNLLLGRFDLTIPFVSFKEQRHITRGTEHISVASTLGENVRKVMSVHTGMRCMQQESIVNDPAALKLLGKAGCDEHFGISRRSKHQDALRWLAKLESP
ncbi:hypothetical protein F2Q69_00011983 [Brassica cretica]|uniref:Uncharacterized protein n=1 Tax=Brassica cretica TaxID=69181 RepID=A0A8S9R6W7_BRACR|nr:hypothetical protein F2Q69_00011983 [Brassica cretica]